MQKRRTSLTEKDVAVKTTVEKRKKKGCGCGKGTSKKEENNNK